MLAKHLIQIKDLVIVQLNLFNSFTLRALYWLTEYKSWGDQLNKVTLYLSNTLELSDKYMYPIVTFAYNYRIHSLRE